MSVDDSCGLLCLDLPHAERIRALLPDPVQVDPVAGHARALGEPTRLRIAAALLVGDELCVCDMAWVVGASQALVSHHLRQLRTVGLVASRKDGRMVLYRITERGRALLSVLLDTEPSVQEGADRV